MIAPPLFVYVGLLAVAHAVIAQYDFEFGSPLRWLNTFLAVMWAVSAVIHAMEFFHA